MFLFNCTVITRFVYQYYAHFCVLFKESFLYPYPFRLVFSFWSSKHLTVFLLLSLFPFKLSLFFDGFFFLPFLPWILAAYLSSFILLSWPMGSCVFVLGLGFREVTASLNSLHLQWNTFCYFHLFFGNTVSAIHFSWYFSCFISWIFEITWVGSFWCFTFEASKFFFNQYWQGHIPA